jgi:type IV secretory pathway VirB4 component
VARRETQISDNSGLLDALTPQALKFEARQIAFGDQFARVMVITDYPPRVGAAWLSRVAALQGVTASIHIVPAQDPGALVNDITRAIGEYTARLSQNNNALIRQRTEQLIRDAEELLQKIDAENQQALYWTVVLLLVAQDMEALEIKTRQVAAMLAATRMRGRVVVFRQEDGLRAAGPWFSLPADIHKVGSRNMLSETVAASFPFVASGINDGSGIVLGRDKDGGLVLVDIWKRGEDRTNSNITILGKTGSGKSFASKLLVVREFPQGTKVIIIDPLRECRAMCKRLGGNWMNVAGGKSRINPLQVRLLPAGEQDEDEEQYFAAASDLSLHIKILRTFFSLYLQDLTDTEKACLENALIATYERKGITFASTSEQIRALKPEDYPIMEDLSRYIDEQANKKPELYERLAILIQRTTLGADAALWDGPSTVDAAADLTVLDIHDLMNADPATKAAQFFNVLTFVWNMIETDAQERIILVVDEAWMLIDKKTPQALEFLRDASKRIRHYNGSLVVISQNLIDFLAPEVMQYGSALINNPCYKLIMQQGEKDLQALCELMNGVSDTEKDLLAGAKRGEGLLIAGNQRIFVKIEAAPHEEPYLQGGGL